MSQITYSQLQELRRLVEEEGYSSASAARQVGVSESSAYYRLRQLGVKLPTRGIGKLAQYGAYDRETDQLVAMGSAREVAAQLGTTEATLRCQVCRGGTRKYQIVRLREDCEG